MNIKLGNIGSKITKHAENIGLLAGLSVDLLPWYRETGMDGMIDTLTYRVTNWKVPDPFWMLEALTTIPVYKKGIKSGAMAWLLGEGMKTFGIGSKYANGLKKFGAGMVKGTVISGLVLLPALNPHDVRDIGNEEAMYERNILAANRSQSRRLVAPMNFSGV